MNELKMVFRFMVVLYLSMVVHGNRSQFSSFVEKGEHLDHSNRVLKSIKSPDGDVIDCVRISDQLAFDNPLLKNHTIKMKPNYYPKWIKDENTKVPSMINSTKFRQLWHSNGKCPSETIPIRRTNKHDLPVKSHRKKKNTFVPQPSSLEPERPTDHEYAVLETDGKFYGTKATFSIWNPYVQEHNEFSLAQLWILGGPQSTQNTIEAGWQVCSDIYGDTKTRLFIYWTNDGYKTGYYNLNHVSSTSSSPYRGMGFIQTNTNIVIGGALSPVSQVDGLQSEMTIYIWKDSSDGNWWMKLGDEVVGYWPAALFPNLSNGASTVQWGGEVVNKDTNGYHTSTQMGSGHFPTEGFGKASYIKHIQIVDESVTSITPKDFSFIIPEKSCYDLVMGTDNDGMGTYFLFGGPGRNQDCK